MKIHKHHRGLALGFIALSAFYYFGILSNQSSAVMLNCSTAGSINVPVQECWGLVELFNNTNGASWTNSTNWNTNTNICTWYGVGCSNIAGQDRVTRVNLPSNNLAGGPLPPSMSGLRFITGLDLGSNAIRGTLPSSWSTWTGITNFNVNNNQLSGTLPTSWSTWTGIVTFGAANNNLGGALPTTWTGWKSLQSIQLSMNLFTGTLPSEWGGWSSISFADFNNTAFTGALPSSWSGWTNMTQLYIHDTNISGPLPASWSTWTNMNKLYAYRSQLVGTLPTTWSTWTKINEFNVRMNHLTGTLPTAWSAWTGITSFSVGANQITGSLPSSWSTWTKIEYMELGGNNLRGTVPASWSSMNLLQQIDLRQNYLTGQIPSSWTSMASMITGGFMIDYNCFDTLLPEPPSDFVDGRAGGTGWQLTQYWCILSDLAIEKDSTTYSGPIGSFITYTIHYINSGDMAVSGVYLYDSWPLGLTFISSTVSGEFIGGGTGGDIRWEIGELLPMQSGTIIVTGQIETNWDGIPFVSGDTIQNTSYIYGRVHDLLEENYISESPLFTVLEPDTSSDLAVVKVNGASTGLIGTNFTYIINYINSGDSSVSGVTVYDTLPAGFSFVSSSPAPSSVSGTDIEWNIGTLTAMQSGRIFLTGNIGPSFSSGDILMNTSTIDGYVMDVDNNNNFSTTSPVTLFETVVPSDLIITKTISGSLSNVRVGSLIPYVIHYINSGGTSISGVVIRDLLMTGLTIPDYDAAIPAPTIFTGFRDITWSLGTLAPMQSGTILLYAMVSGPFTSGQSVTNTATIDSYGSDINLGNNTSTTNPLSIIYSTGDLVISKRLGSGNIIDAGSIVAYDIYYRAIGDMVQEPLVISDVMPAGLTYISSDFSNNPLSLDYTTGIIVTGSSISWQLWTLSPGSTGSFRVYAQVGGGVASGTVITNTASITGDIEDINLANNTSSSQPLTVRGAVFTGDLQVFKSASVGYAISGQPISFTLTYANTGSSTLTGVWLRDYMQEGFTYVSSNYTSGLTVTTNTFVESIGEFPSASRSFTGTLLSWFFPSIPAHTSSTITIQALVNDTLMELSGAINIATITGSNYQELNLNDNVSTVLVLADSGSVNGSGYSSGYTPPNTTPNDDDRGYGGGGGWDITPPPSNIATLGSAPTLADDEVCPYKDGDFERYKTTFKDIQNSIFKPAVDIMLDYCLVQGEYNGGKMFGVYNYLRWGEAYKVFSRLAGLSFSRTANPAHWSDRYRFAGMKVNLWSSITSQPHNPRSYISYADVFTIANNILRYYKKPPLAYDPTLNYNNAISRGKFALFIQHIIETIKE